MNFNDYYREVPAASSSPQKTSESIVWKSIRLILSTELFKYSIPAHVSLQLFVEYASIFTTFSFENCQRLCNSPYEFSTRTREVTLLILGAFIVISTLYFVRLCITIANLGVEGINSPHLWSYSKAFVIAIMPVMSMSSYVISNWGGICVDGFG